MSTLPNDNKAIGKGQPQEKMLNHNNLAVLLSFVLLKVMLIPTVMI